MDRFDKNRLPIALQVKMTGLMCPFYRRWLTVIASLSSSPRRVQLPFDTPRGSWEPDWRLLGRLPPPSIALSGDTRNVQITDSLLSIVTVAASTKRVQLQNITFGAAGGNYCAFANVSLPAVNPALPYGSIAYGPNNPFPGPIANITAINMGDYCAGL